MSQCGNLDEKEIARRRLGGVIGFVAALLMVLMIRTVHPPDWVRLMTFFPFFFGYIGILQAQEETCVFLVATGVRLDERIKAQLQRKSVRIVLVSLVLAALSTALVWFYL